MKNLMKHSNDLKEGFMKRNTQQKLKLGSFYCTCEGYSLFKDMKRFGLDRLEFYVAAHVEV